MLAAALLFLAQDPAAQVPTAQAPAPEATEGEEIVVRATFGRTTMLFDRGSDGKLRNCRIMISSGSQKRDTDACKATPVCYAPTADQVTDCIELTALEPVAIETLRPAKSADGAQAFTLPQLVKPAPAVPKPQVGPAAGKAGEDPEAERQRVKLPPLPKAPTGSDGVSIRISNAQDQ